MDKKIHILIIPVFFLGIHSLNFADNHVDLGERTPYSIPLVKLSLTNNATAIRITKNNDDDYAIIGQFDDLLVKNTKDKVTRTTFRELPNQAHCISEFESRYLLLTCHSLIETLEDFERNLHMKKWGQCLYLDAFLPKFLRNFYLLLDIAQNNAGNYMDVICLFDGKYDISLNSPLSDKRITTWKNNDDYLMKLRISTKELAHQLRLWEKRVLSKDKRNSEISLNANTEDALELFIKIYFGIKSTDICPPEIKKRLQKQI